MRKNLFLWFLWYEIFETLPVSSRFWETGVSFRLVSIFPRLVSRDEICLPAITGRSDHNFGQSLQKKIQFFEIFHCGWVQFTPIFQEDPLWKLRCTVIQFLRDKKGKKRVDFQTFLSKRCNFFFLENFPVAVMEYPVLL